VNGPQTNLLEQFLTPNPTDREVVVLADKEMSGSVMVSRSHTVAMSGEATRLVHSALVDAAPLKLRDVLHSTPRLETALTWIKDSIEEGMFGVSPEPPPRTKAAPTTIDARSHIAVSDFAEGVGVPVEYPGTVTRVTVNRTTLYWYSADVSLKEKRLVPTIGYESSVSMQGPLGIGLLPKPVPAEIKVHCGRCGVCGVCGACGACGLCGGVDFAAALVAVDAVIAAVAAVNAVSAFGALRAQ